MQQLLLEKNPPTPPPLLRTPGDWNCFLKSQKNAAHFGYLTYTTIVKGESETDVLTLLL
jgi:hypothetical protein